MATKTLNPNLVALLNKVDPPGRVLAHMVPTRILRITDVKDDGMTFRVEQLTMTSRPHDPKPRGDWHTLSTHGGQRAGEGLRSAKGHAEKAQEDLIAKLRTRLGIVPKQVTQ